MGHSNVCYRNASLQALARTPLGKLIADTFTVGDFPSTDTTAEGAATAAAQASAAQKILRLLHYRSSTESNGEVPLSLLKEFHNAMHGIDSVWKHKKNTQQDASEFLNKLLDILGTNKIYPLEEGVRDLSNPDVRERNPITAHCCLQFKEYKTPKETSDKFVDGGVPQEPALAPPNPPQQLPLEEDKNSIQECLHRALAEESVEFDLGRYKLNETTNNYDVVGDETCICTRRVTHLPKTLILHVKRFRADSFGHTERAGYPVDFPVEFEFPPELCTDALKGTHYKLCSRVLHKAGDPTELNLGHYTADSLEGRAAMTYNDRTVKPEEILTAHSSSTYIYFYERIDPELPAVGTAATAGAGAGAGAGAAEAE